MPLDGSDDRYKAFCGSMFAFSDPYHGPMTASPSPQVTEVDMEAWAERANRFLNGCPNRAARVRPKYAASSSGLGGRTLFESFT